MPQESARPSGRETKADADIANVLTMDEARRIAVNIAKLPRGVLEPWSDLANYSVEQSGGNAHVTHSAFASDLFACSAAYGFLATCTLCERSYSHSEWP
jgi:hypothetical protein